ncbi:site-specific integrase [Burkholderia pseudomallei]|uniref:site-specific integrase n=1 Tax=Burkholderia pseudomallei TaxID=28450 RepID=UPI0027DF0F1B|nr:site-specific integrase [Burkholderia pseudomallei]
MLERHFRSFKAIDRIKAQWLGPQIERYTQLLDELHTCHATVWRHIGALGHFNDFVIARGATRLEELPSHIDAFVEHWQAEHGGWCKSAQDRAAVVAQCRVPVERMLCLALPGYTRPSNRPAMPFATLVPGFFPFLLNEKGLRQTSLHGYTYTLRRFEAYLEKAGIALSALMPADITGFINECAKTLHKSGMLSSTCALRVFLRYLHREGIIATDLVRSVPRGRTYRQASMPRAIAWEDVERLLTSIDRRPDLGKRDYAILTLLASYGLRAREIAALCLDDFDWVLAQISIPRRKGGHSSRYPLSATVGEAVIAYLQVRRPDVDHRQVFLTAKSPYAPMQHSAISCMVSVRMRHAGINVMRAGSHTLRHTCVQHLIEADMPFKVIGDYVGHRDPAATLIYGKVALHKLREIVTA